MQNTRVAVLLGARHDIDTDQRVQRTIRALSGAGYNVTIHSPQNVRVPFRNCGIAKRLQLDYLLFNLTLAWSVWRSKPDVCHCNDLDTLLAGSLVKMMSLGRAKVLYDCHEDYPPFVAMNHGRIFGRIVGYVEEVLSRLFVDAVVWASTQVDAKFAKWGIKGISVLNCPETPEKYSYGKFETFTIVCQGSMQKGRGYEELIEAIRILGRKGLGINLMLIGKRNKYYMSLYFSMTPLSPHALRVGSVQHTSTGHIEHSQMMKTLQMCHVGVALLDIKPRNYIAMPNKLFEDMACRIPVIASNLPCMSEVIKGVECGLLVDNNEPNEIADAVEMLYKNDKYRKWLGDNGRIAAEGRYSEKAQGRKLLSIYQEVVG